jgi:hypothetical protein
MAHTIAHNNKKATEGLPRLAYTMHETAAILGVSYITIHRLLKRGLLRSSTALRHKLIPAVEIERFLKTTTNIV